MRVFLENKKIVKIENAQDLYVGENGSIITLYSKEVINSPYLRGKQSTGRVFEVLPNVNSNAESVEGYANKYDFYLSSDSGYLIAPGKLELELWYQPSSTTRQCMGKVQTNAHSSTYNDGEGDVVYNVNDDLKSMRPEFETIKGNYLNVVSKSNANESRSQANENTLDTLIESDSTDESGVREVVVKKAKDAVNVVITDDESAKANEIKFKIGTGSYSKVIDNVDHAKEATKDSQGNVIHETYETKDDSARNISNAINDLIKKLTLIENNIKVLNSTNAEVADDYSATGKIKIEFDRLSDLINQAVGGDLVGLENKINELSAKFELFMTGTSADNVINTLVELREAILDRYAKSQVYTKDETYSKTEVDAVVSSAKNEAISTASNDATQKANTAEANAKSYTDSKFGELDTANLEHNEVIYSKSVEEDGIIELKEVGGVSEASENLIVLEDKSATTVNGVTYSVNGGVITLNGTATGRSDLNFMLENSIYIDAIISYNSFIEGSKSSNWNFILRNGDIDITNITNSFSNKYFNFVADRILYSFASGHTFNNFKIKPMLVKGTVAPSEFKAGFNGLRYNYPTAIKRVGKNKLGELVNLKYKSNAVGTYSTFAEENENFSKMVVVRLTPNTNYVLSGTMTNVNNNLAILLLSDEYPKVGVTYYRDNNLGIRGYFNSGNHKFAALYFQFDNKSFPVDVSNLQLEIGTIPTSYTPYEEYSAEIQPVINEVASKLNIGTDWLGYGVSATEHNYIDFARKKAVVKYGKYAYTTGDENNANYLTDGSTTTIKPLATPFEVDVDIPETHIIANTGDTLILENEYNAELPISYKTVVSLKKQVEANWQHDNEQQKRIEELERQVAQLLEIVNGASETSETMLLGGIE